MKCSLKKCVQNVRKKKDKSKRLKRSKREEALEAKLASIQSPITSGKDLYQQQKFELAMKEFEEVLRMEPTNKVAFQYLDLCEEMIALQEKKEYLKVSSEREKVIEEEFKFYQGL